MSKARFPQYHFANEGIRFSVEYLRNMRDKLHKLTIKECSEFVDGYTYDCCKIGKQVLRELNLYNSLLGKITTTQIGNMAFIYLYHPNQKQKQIALETFNKIKQHDKTYFKTNRNRVTNFNTGRISGSYY